MIAAILIAMSLANAEGFLEFRRCYLDISKWPYEFRPYEQGDVSISRSKTILVKPSAILFLSQPEGSIAGIACTRIATGHGASFVVGSLEEVKKRITEAD